MTDRIQSFAEFYPYYLGEHANGTCRQLHVVGTSTALGLLIHALATGTWWLLLLVLPVGYGFAWVGHFVFEKSRPAMFQYPLWSFMSDWVMLKDVLTGRLPATGQLDDAAIRAVARSAPRGAR